MDDLLRPMAEDLFATFGKTATIRRTVPGSYDPVTGTTGDPVITDYAVKASPPGRYELDYVDGTLIQRNDMKVSVAADGLAITPGDGDSTDTFIMDGATYNIVNVEAVYSGEQAALYTLQVRR